MTEVHPNLRPFVEMTQNSPEHDLQCGSWEGIPSAAIFSPDAIYRYVLVRIWDSGKPVWLFAMLNPSKATHKDGDNTVDRQVKRATQHGAGGIIVVNAGAIRETDRKLAIRHADPIGPHNGFWIARVAPLAEVVVLAHGPDAAHFGGDRLLSDALSGRACHVLRLTKNGSPEHPLYLAYDLPLIAYRPAATS